MAALGSAVDSVGPFVDGDTILDGILRRSRSAWPAAFVTTREIREFVAHDVDSFVASGKPSWEIICQVVGILVQIGTALLKSACNVNQSRSPKLQ